MPRFPTCPVVYVADDCPDVRELMRLWLESLGCQPRCFGDGEALCDGVERCIPDLVFLDLMMPRMSGMEALGRLKARNVICPVIVLSAVDDVKTVVQAVQLGARDYETKPLSLHRIEVLVRDTLESKGPLPLASDSGGIVGNSPAMRPVHDAIERCSSSQISVLISGESGTGKELVARAIHRRSRRLDGPFVAINCGAIPESLQESELFGHERGAFTGAVAAHQGYFERAQAGTVFLDEVSALSPSAQKRLLRVLQERQVQRLGGSKLIDLQLRVISATNQPLHHEVRRGAFRRDLYYRLAVFPIEVPPLRERKGDILLLAEHFAEKHFGCPELAVSPEVRDILERHSWPGNVRELENVVQYALVSTGSLRTADALPRLLHMEEDWQEETSDVRSVRCRSHDLRDIERATIADALCFANGNLSEAARRLGMSRATLYRKLARYRAEGEKARKLA